MYSKQDKSEISRIESLEANPDSPFLKFPTIGNTIYLIEFLVNELGVCRSDSFGLAPLNWTELYSWSKIKNIKLTDWESTTIIHLSRTYVSSHNKYNESNEPAPYVHEEYDKDAASANVKSFFKALAARRNKNGKTQ